MADTSNLTNFLEDIADAIRTKKSTTEEIPAADFDTEILSIETGIDTSDANATANDITIDKTAYVNGEKVTGTLPLFPNSRTFTVDGGITNDTENNRIQIHTINTTKQILDSNLNMEFNGEYADVADAIGLTADKILEGNTILGVEGTAETGTEINNQDKEITKNGTYTADEGYTGLGTVTVNVPQTGDVPVKLFETQEEMQADSTAQEGDLAVVYREEIQNMTADTQTQYITFPETVTLPEAFTDSFYGTLRAVDESVMFNGQVMLGQSMFDFNGHSETGMIRVRYQSEDGITYTRQAFMGDSGDLTNPVDLGTVVKYEPMEPWNDTLGYFMQIGGNVFDGLYKYNTVTDTTRIDMMQNIRRDDSNELVYDAVPIKVDTLSTIIQAARTSISTNVTNYALSSATFHQALIEKLSDTEYNVYFRAYLSSSKIVLSYCGLFEQDGIYYLADYPSAWFNTTVGTLANSTESKRPRVYAMLKINVNLDTGVSTYTELPASDFTQTSIDGYTHAKYNKAFDANFTLVEVRYIVNSRTVTNDGSLAVTNSSNNSESISTKYTTMYIYDAAPTQLTATPDYVYEKEFYGKNGVETGTLGTPDNSFADTNAEIVYKIQNQYENMEPRVLTDDDKTIDKNMYFIPVKKDGTPLLDTSSVTNMYAMFDNCTNLQTIPLLDTSSVTNMTSMFQECINLTSIPLLDTSSVTNMTRMFQECINLTSIPLLDTSSVTNMHTMFANCTNLQTIPLLDTSSVVNMTSMFANCTSLTDDSLNNILAMCTNAVKITSKNKTLKYIGLTEEQATKCTTLSNYSTFTAAGWTTGY